MLDLDGAAAERAAAGAARRGCRRDVAQVDVADRACGRRARSTQVRDAARARSRSSSRARRSPASCRFEDITLEDWERTIAVNLTGTFHCMQAAIADMVAAGWGRIVTISSAAGQTGSPRQAHYSASKGGVIALTKTVALEFAAAGHHRQHDPAVHASTPRCCAPRRTSEHLPSAEVLARMIPPGGSAPATTSPPRARSCAPTKPSYITGQVIAVNGGAVT